MADINKIIEEVGSLTMQEAADMAKLMEEKWGIVASQIQTGSAPVVESASDALKSITLKSYGEGKKILVIKAIRKILGLGLLESKQFTEALPKEIMSDIDSDKVEEIKTELAPAGCEFEIK